MQNKILFSGLNPYQVVPLSTKKLMKKKIQAHIRQSDVLAGGGADPGCSIDFAPPAPLTHLTTVA